MLKLCVGTLVIDDDTFTLAPEKMKEVVTFLESRRRAAFERLGRPAPQIPCFFEIPA